MIGWRVFKLNAAVLNPLYLIDVPIGRLDCGPFPTTHSKFPPKYPVLPLINNDLTSYPPALS